MYFVLFRISSRVSFQCWKAHITHFKSSGGTGITGSTHLHPHALGDVVFLIICWALSSIVLLYHVRIEISCRTRRLQPPHSSKWAFHPNTDSFVPLLRLAQLACSCAFLESLLPKSYWGRLGGTASSQPPCHSWPGPEWAPESTGPTTFSPNNLDYEFTARTHRVIFCYVYREARQWDVQREQRVMQIHGQKQRWGTLWQMREKATKWAAALVPSGFPNPSSRLQEAWLSALLLIRVMERPRHRRLPLTWPDQCTNSSRTESKGQGILSYSKASISPLMLC